MTDSKGRSGQSGAGAYEHSTRVRSPRIAMSVSRWEEFVERRGWAERWECLDRQGRWRRYWRRHVPIPKWGVRK